MKNVDLLIILAIFFLLFPNLLPAPPAPKPLVIASDFTSEGMVAFGYHNTHVETNSPEPIVTECKCNGTGFVKSGDGFVDIPCQCGNSCDCAKEPVSPPEPNIAGCGCGNPQCNCPAGRTCKPKMSLIITTKKDIKILDNQILYFTASWCGPCQVVEQNIIPELKQKGWGVDQEDASLIKKLDVDLYPELFDQYKLTDGIPQFVMIRNGKAVGYVNPVNAKQVTDLYFKHAGK